MTPEQSMALAKANAILVDAGLPTYDEVLAQIKRAAYTNIRPSGIDERGRMLVEVPAYVIEGAQLLLQRVE